MMCKIAFFKRRAGWEGGEASRDRHMADCLNEKSPSFHSGSQKPTESYFARVPVPITELAQCTHTLAYIHKHKKALSRVMVLLK